MNDWKKVKLGEVCKIKSGKRLPKGCEFSDTPTKYKYIRARDIKNGIINGEELAYITEETQYKISKYIVNSDDIVITIVGASVGDVAYISSQYNGVNLTENAVRLTQFNTDVNSRYLFYILNSPNYYQLMQRIAGGAAQPKMGIYKVEAIEVYLPSLSTQQRIATILSRYDSLIENYQKQIKLLEESAQRLYKEWFIDLRFPGYENTKIVNGVPDGWEKKKIIELVKVQYGFAFDGKLFNSNGEGMPILRIRNIPDGITSDYTTEEASEDYIVHNGDIVVGMDGIFHINTWSGKNAYLVQRACSFRPIEEGLKGFVLQAIKEPIKYFEQTLVGATVAHLGKKHIDSIEVIVPNNKELFEPLQKMFKQRQNMLNQIRLLTEARDRLLPKLMNGEIEV